MTTPANRPAPEQAADLRRDRQPDADTDTRQERSWADEAAEARTTDDPRIRPPHDRLGVPSTEDRPHR